MQLAEALAEYVHALIRIECGFSSEEPGKNREILAQNIEELDILLVILHVQKYLIQTYNYHCWMQKE